MPPGDDRSLADLLRLVVLTLVVVTALAVPVIHFDVQRRYLDGNLATLSVLTAEQLMRQVIARDPEFWVYEDGRIGGLLRDEVRGVAVRQVVYAEGGEAVVEIGAPLPAPLLRQRQWLLDAGRPVGALETSASLRPLLRDSLLLALVLVVIGGTGAALLCRYPLARLRRAECDIRYLAEHDPLTGLLNRHVVESLFERESARARRHHLRLSIVIFDIDHFKRVNDQHGHDCGDRVLRQLSGLVSRHVRASDYLVRWGGEEFLILSTHTDLAMARALVEKLRRLVAEHDFGLAQPITISLGVCACSPGEELQHCVSCADAAMYRAKRAGRNRWFEGGEHSITEG
ncbi:MULTISPECIES: GGDEF domain-containing protein [unclassified Marichromatium]|uniref:GGDEF domain-containing protein n=1 Tax=unclassified Marichromatium TaxID=2618417 RepID=UPI000F415EDE|nr:GGDEF domain-containing protein [Marichromatium sp. AB31]MBO8086176.1 GGDEF domain-containing protein [Marichromatium sp.]RNE89159.1 GGDEF domain-containing protein [Marichromatium sp. AB31]